MIRAVVVVVPAHNEELRLADCLRSVSEACAALGAAIFTRTVVVLDACTDRSMDVANTFVDGTRNQLVEVMARNVGEARSFGFKVGMRGLAHSPDEVWLATTDADSIVPRSWLADQIALAHAGAHATVGTVRVRDWRGFSPSYVDAFERFYETHGGVATHGHVHGANLGLRADAYVDVGGFMSLETGEDHALVSALRIRGRNVVATRGIEVTTSARLDGRTPDGFAHFLANFTRNVA